MLLLTRRITRHPAMLANAARKTSWAAPEAPSWLRRVEHWLRPPAPRGDPLQLLPWELTSPAALETRGDAARDADLLSYAGVIVRRNAVCRDAVAVARTRAEELAAEATRRATARGADAGDASAGFHFADASQRGPFRLDLRLGAALEAPPFDLSLHAIWPHVRAALGEDAVLRRRGLVVGLPGASDQARGRVRLRLLDGVGVVANLTRIRAGVSRRRAESTAGSMGRTREYRRGAASPFAGRVPALVRPERDKRPHFFPAGVSPALDERCVRGRGGRAWLLVGRRAGYSGRGRGRRDRLRLSDAARGRREPLATRAAGPVPRLRAAVVRRGTSSAARRQCGPRRRRSAVVSGVFFVRRRVIFVL